MLSGIHLEQNPPMVGREKEQEQLLSHLGEAISGEGRLVLISGEAGVGKTRLCGEFERRATALGCVVLVGRCVPGVPSPYLPFQEAFSKYASIDSHLDGIFGKRTDGLSPRSKSEMALLSCLEFLAELSEEKVVVLRLEDLQWADSQTTQMVHFLARNCVRLRAIIVGTLRTEEIAPNATGAVHPMIEVLRIMRREGVCSEIDLLPLNNSEVGEAVTGMLGPRVDPLLLSEVSEECRGNPLFMVELVRMLYATEEIEHREGVWYKKGDKPMDIPPTVREVVLHRLDLIGKEQRRTLELASVIGEAFEPELIANILGKNNMAVLETLEEMEHDHHLVIEGNDRFRFAHQKIQQVVYDVMSPLKRKELHRLIGLGLLSADPDDATLSRLVRHFEEAGDDVRLARYATEAGEHCLRRYSLAEAKTLFEKALKANQVALDSDVRSRSLEGLGDIEVEAGHFEKALECYELALTDELRNARKVRILRKEAEVWGPTAFGKGDSRRTTELLDMAESIPDADPLDAALMKTYRGDISLLGGDPLTSLALTEKAEAMLQKQGDKGALVSAYSTQMMALLSLGRSDEAIEKARRSLEILAQIGDKPNLPGKYFDLATAYWHKGYHAEALAALDKSDELFREMGFTNGIQLCWDHFYKGYVHQSARDFARSLDEAIIAEAQAQRNEGGYVILGIKGVKLHALLHLGRLEEARKECQELRQICDSFHWNVKTPSRGLNHAVYGEMLGIEGKSERSDEQFQRALVTVEGGIHSTLMMALINMFWGECLNREGNGPEARHRYESAKALYERLGNETQIKMIDSLISEIDVK